MLPAAFMGKDGGDSWNFFPMWSLRNLNYTESNKKTISYINQKKTRKYINFYNFLYKFSYFEIVA